MEWNGCLVLLITVPLVTRPSSFPVASICLQQCHVERDRVRDRDRGRDRESRRGTALVRPYLQQPFCIATTCHMIRKASRGTQLARCCCRCFVVLVQSQWQQQASKRFLSQLPKRDS
ncbi:unnamed protein product [Ectocarpus sp. 12 AP-2014]